MSAISDNYYNAQSWESLAMLEPAIAALQNATLHSVTVQAHPQGAQPKISITFETGMPKEEATHSDFGPEFNKLRKCYQFVMDRAKATGAKDLTGLKVIIRYTSPTNPMNALSMILTPQPITDGGRPHLY